MQTNKILQWLIVGGLVLVPFVAFLVPGGMFFPFIVGKNFAFRILVEIVFAPWLLLYLRDRHIGHGALGRVMVVIPPCPRLAAGWFTAVD